MQRKLHRLLYFIGMREELAKTLLSLPHGDNDRLPSVRTLMNTYRVSSGTVQAALASLSKAGKIQRIQGKGCFWVSSDTGNAQQIFPQAIRPTVRETIPEKLERLFNEDWARGELKADAPLPLMKELALRYDVSQSILRSFLMDKVDRGILARAGRKFFFVNKRDSRSQDSLSELIFVTRCNSWGGFTAESEREMDFLRMVYKKAGADNYKLILLGINEKNGQIIDRSGKPHKLSDFPNAVGAILSTLLVMQPQRLLHLFAGVKFPVSVWWEHPTQAIPLRFVNKQNWTFFNSTFGPIPGIEMGKFLLSKGFNQVLYISPYHDSSWSVDRLEGLRASGISVTALTDEEFASPWDYKQIARSKVAKFSVEVYARELVKKKIFSLVARNKASEQQPLVCVNDEVASVLIELAEEGKLHISKQIFGFDNSAESYLLRLPSYEFNTQALVDHMFYSIENPDAFTGTKKVQQILGSVIEK